MNEVEEQDPLAIADPPGTFHLMFFIHSTRPPALNCCFFSGIKSVGHIFLERLILGEWWFPPQNSH